MSGSESDRTRDGVAGGRTGSQDTVGAGDALRYRIGSSRSRITDILFRKGVALAVPPFHFRMVQPTRSSSTREEGKTYASLASGPSPSTAARRPNIPYHVNHTTIVEA